MPTKAKNRADKTVNYSNLAALTFILLLIISLVGPKPLAEPIAVTSLDRSSIPVWYQLIFGACYFLVFILVVKTNIKLIFSLLSPPLLAIIVLALASATWSLYPGAALTAALRVIALCIAMSVCITRLGAERAWRVFGWFLASLVFFNYISLFISPYSMHTAQDWDYRIIGAWRGLHEHKNIAAPIMFFAAFYWMDEYFCRGGMWRIAISALSLGFVVGTGSKTTLALSLCLLISLFLIYHSRRHSREIKTIVLLFFVIAIMAISVLLTDKDVTAFLLGDGSGFSGRSVLWQMVLANASVAPLTGFGFNSFWRVGVDGPTYDYAVGWFAASYSGHNGYLDLLVTLGYPGLIFALGGLIVWPMLDFVRWGALVDPACRKAAIGLGFGALHNLLESSFMVASSEAFVLWLIAAFSLRLRRPQPQGLQEHKNNLDLEANRVVSGGFK
jgi:O-antigen ligase